MQKSSFYYKWFQKTISIVVECFFLISIIATLYVLTSSFNGTLRYIVFVLLALVYVTLIVFFKEKVKKTINVALDKLSIISEKNMLIILLMTILFLKAIYTLLFYFDPTQGGDIQLYNELAERLMETNWIASGDISHLVGIARHLIMFKKINMPLHIGMFALMFVASIMYFLAFKKIVGKEKAFLLMLLYILMPSTMLLSFAPTHEVFAYFYFSFFIFFFNKLFEEDNKYRIVLYSIIVLITVILVCKVSPLGMIIYVILGLSILLSNVNMNKKIIIGLVLMLSLLSTKITPKRSSDNRLTTDMNTYYILIHGANIDSLGEQVDDFPNQAIREWMLENGTSDNYNYDTATEAAKNVLINQYKYLFTHPVDLVRIVAHKLYILWSGDHYSVELAHTYGAVSDIGFYLMLGLSTMIYLTALTIGMFFTKRKDDCIDISNCKLIVLGTAAITLFSVILNKYGIPITVFIYLVAFYRADLGNYEV